MLAMAAMAAVGPRRPAEEPEEAPASGTDNESTLAAMSLYFCLPRANIQDHAEEDEMKNVSPLLSLALHS
jgi:hypothetical protein